MNLIIDSSIALKWFLPEKESVRALAIRENAFNKTVTLHTCELLFFECSNVLAYKTLADDQKQEIILDLFAVPFILHPFDNDLAQYSLELSNLYKISVYDASYIALATELHCEFLTADEKLVKTASSLGFVKLL